MEASEKITSPLERTMVFSAANAVLSKFIESAPAVVLAWPTAQRKLPVLPSSSVLSTVNVAGTRRSSNGTTAIRVRPIGRRVGWLAVRKSGLRIQLRIAITISGNEPKKLHLGSYLRRDCDS